MLADAQAQLDWATDPEEAVRCDPAVYRPLYRGRREAVDCDLANYFGEIPRAKLMERFARRIGDGRMLELSKGATGNVGEGGRRKGRRAPLEPGVGKGSGEVAALAFGQQPVMRRFVLGWKTLGSMPGDSGRRS